MWLFLNLFTVKENVPELLVIEPLVARLIMLRDHGQDLVEGHLLADFLHGKTDVVGFYVARVVCIELLEDGLEFGVGEEVLDIDSCRQKLAVIDLMVTREVHLIDDVLDLLIIGAHSLTDKDIL